MSIGIYDMDLMTYKVVPFNLEAMKLSSYYKKKGEIVVLATQFCPERHSRFFVRKDYDDGIYPPNMGQIENVEYGGNAFSNNVYVPLPLEIEKSKPDTSLYAKTKNIFERSTLYTETERKKVFRNLLEAEHGRLSLDGKTIWEDYERQFAYLPAAKNLILHDYDLGAVEGSFEITKGLLDRARKDGWATRIGMKYPIKISKGQDLLNWCSLRPNSTMFSLEYDGIVPADAFTEFVGMIKEKSIYKQLDYWITRGGETEEELIAKMPLIFKQLVLSRGYRVRYTLRYDKGFFSDERWEKMIKLFNFFQHSMSKYEMYDYLLTIPDATFFEFSRRMTDKPPKYYKMKETPLSKEEIREIFLFASQQNVELFNLFYECNLNSLGGKI